MRSIKSRFDYQIRKNPGLSTLICFNKAIMGQRFKSKSIRENFNELVDKKDYQESDKKKILKYSYELSFDKL